MKKKKRMKGMVSVYCMMVPGLVYLLINNYLPMFGLVIAFKKINWSKGILGSEWVGLDNFKYLFATKDAWIITRNTVLYNLAFIIIGTVCAIAIAILMNEVVSKIKSRIYQTVILLPFLISWVVAGNLVYSLLSSDTGFLNQGVFSALGMEAISWYQEPKYWPAILILVNLWKTIGFSMVIYLSTIVGISSDYYEAAKLDGAGKWKQIKYITLPMLKSTIITLTILNIGKIFYSDFGLFYQIPRNSGALYDVTQTIDTYVYNALMQQGNISMSAAAGFYQSMVGFALVFITNLIVRKISKEDALF